MTTGYIGKAQTAWEELEENRHLSGGRPEESVAVGTVTRHSSLPVYCTY